MTVEQPSAGPPPTAPGALGERAAPSEVLDYLAAMNAWTARVRATLDELDDRARGAGTDSGLTGDITLAYTLWQSITVRVGELTTVWDSGRVGATELEQISTLLWSRLDDDAGGLPVSLTEACVLADALLNRLAQRIEADPRGGRGGGRKARGVRESLERSRRHAESLGRPTAAADADRIEADLERVLSLLGDADAADRALSAVDAAASALERDLIVAGAAVASLARERGALSARMQAATARAAQVRATAASCAAAVSGPPVLAVPDPSRLGPVPEENADWDAVRAAVDAYAQRLTRVEAALDTAAERYGRPLAELAELAGLLDAYRAKATAFGLAGEVALATVYDDAHATLASRPCDLDRARELVGSYRRAVDSGEDARTTRRPATAEREGGQR